MRSAVDSYCFGLYFLLCACIYRGFGLLLLLGLNIDTKLALEFIRWI